MFGRVVKKDDRDKKYRIKRRTTDRKIRHWSDNSAFLDQTVTPECVGYTCSHLMLNQPIVQYVNPSGVYEIAKRFDEWRGENYEGTSVRAGAQVLQMLGFISEYRWTWDLNVMINAVLTQGPVMIGVNWYEGMMETDREGYVHVTGDSVGGHATLVNGVNVKKERFRIKQSWGREWGNKGRCYISFQDMRRLIREDGEICLPIESQLSKAFR